MPYEPLSPLPFCPIPGKLDLTTFIPGWSDYEILAKVLEQYNKAIAEFNTLLELYGDYEDYTHKLETKLTTEITNFENKMTKQQNDYQKKIDAQIKTVNDTVKKCYDEVQKLINGDYIESYVTALAKWIDNNLQVMVSRVVTYVWFAIDENGYFVAYIPDQWDFVNFDTELNPDDEDYGKLRLLWEPEVVQ